MILKRSHDPALLFRRSLARKLRSFKRDSPKRHSGLCGLIDHGGGLALVAIRNFNNPLAVPPSINCSEPWIRRTPSWHYETQNFRFCWVLQQEWTQHFLDRKKAGDSIGTMCGDAANWLVNAMAIVLSRHWIGSETGLYDWPNEWEDYSHGDAGVREYEAGKYRQL